MYFYRLKDNKMENYCFQTCTNVYYFEQDLNVESFKT